MSLLDPTAVPIHIHQPVWRCRLFHIPQLVPEEAFHILSADVLHRMRHIIAELSARLPPAERTKPEVEEMAGYGCLTQMHVVRLLAPGLALQLRFPCVIPTFR